MDAFSNCDKAQRISSPVLIMHGLNDEIIDINQAMALHRLLGHVSVMPLFIAGKYSFMLIPIVSFRKEIRNIMFMLIVYWCMVIHLYDLCA